MRHKVLPCRLMEVLGKGNYCSPSQTANRVDSRCFLSYCTTLHEVSTGIPRPPFPTRSQQRTQAGLKLSRFSAVSPPTPAGTLTVFPLTHSVASELDAIADPQPKVLKRASTIFPFSSTSTCKSVSGTSAAGSAPPGAPEPPSQAQAGLWLPPSPREQDRARPGPRGHFRAGVGEGEGRPRCTPEGKGAGLGLAAAPADPLPRCQRFPKVTCSFMTSPQAGAPTRPVPTFLALRSREPTLRGFS